MVEERGDTSRGLTYHLPLEMKVVPRLGRRVDSWQLKTLLPPVSPLKSITHGLSVSH